MDTGHTILDGIVNIFLLCALAGFVIILLFLLIRLLFKILMGMFGLAALPFILVFSGIWFVLKIIFWPFKSIYLLFSSKKSHVKQTNENTWREEF